MAERSFPFADVNMYEDGWQTVMRMLGADGVEYGREDQLSLTSVGGMAHRLGTGNALVNGFGYRNDTPLDLAFASGAGAPPGSGLARNDLVVLHLDRDAESIRAQVLTGTWSATPTDPGLTQTDQIYDLPLWRARINGGASAPSIITDLRRIYRPQAGIVASATGPGIQTDCTAEVPLVTLSAYLVAGRRYRITAASSGSQITNAGIPRTRVLINNAVVLPGGGYVSYEAANVAVGNGTVGNSTFFYTPVSTGIYTISLTGYVVGSGALRVAANNDQLTVEDRG